MSERLHARLLERIRSEGPITFADFMTAALYDPEDGFFTDSSIADHFLTSPHVSPVFGALLTTQIHDVWLALNEPNPLTVVEMGAGDGTLAVQIREAAQMDVTFARALRYIAVERSERARNELAKKDLVVRASIDEIEPFTGCILANELLDNMPFRLVGQRGDYPVEIKVGAEDGRLVLVQDPPSTASDISHARPVSPEAVALIDSIARVVSTGYAFFFDYGFVSGEQPEPVRGYQSHRLTDVLADPGSTDVTGPVDFDAVARRARSAGLNTWGPVSQRDALMALGYRATLDRMRKEQAELERSGEWKSAVGYFGQRGEAAMLVDPAGLGGLKVLALGTAGLPQPRAMRAR